MRSKPPRWDARVREGRAGRLLTAESMTTMADESWPHVGVVLSNHGGRQLDTARSGIEILVEVMRELNQRGLNTPKFEVYIDGGVRRAADVLKAIALGAKGVGIGRWAAPGSSGIDRILLTSGVLRHDRPFLYAYSAYGTDGVSRAIQLVSLRAGRVGLAGAGTGRADAVLSRRTAQGRDGDEHAPHRGAHNCRPSARDD